MTRRALVAIFVLVGLSCAKDDYVKLYRTADIAPSLESKDVENLKTLGPPPLADKHR